MILEMIIWGFFSYWGWQLGDYVKDKIIDTPPSQEQRDSKDKPRKDF
jgi:hypothetical protein